MPFSKELLMIAERRIKISFLISFRIDVGMLLGSVLLFELRVCIKSDISSGVIGVMKNGFAFAFFKVIRKIPLCWCLCFWSSLLTNVIIKMFCNIFWLTYSSAVYERTIRFPCIDFRFIDYFNDLVSNCFTISFVIFKIFPIVGFFAFL